MTLTQDQLDKAESMSLDELRALALKEAGEAVAEPEAEQKATPARDDKGRFVSDDETLNNSEETEVVDGEPTRQIFRKEIDNGNGVVEVFEADSLEELVDKLAEGKKNASIKIRELSQQQKADVARTQQQDEDDTFVIAERLKKEPQKVIQEQVNKALAEQSAALQRSNDAQSRFVATHPDFIPGQSNGGRMVAWLQSHGHAEITYEGLEKAYQDLKQSGLLELKVEDANDATEEEGAVTQRIAEPKPEATPAPSRKKSSTITTRNRPAATAVNVQPSEDEAYALPLEQLKALANKQLQQNSRE